MKHQIKQINDLLLAHTDTAYLKNANVLIPTEKPLLGVKVPKIRALVKDWHQTNQPDFADCLLLIDGLFNRQIREEILFGIFLLQKYKRYYNTALFAKIDEWIELIENWECCDQLAAVAAPLVAKDPQLFKQLQDWTRSPNLWRRRFVLATGSSLNHHGLSHVEPVLSLCCALINDNEPMVEKALHWAIREVSKKDGERTFEWLMEYGVQMKKSVLRQAVQKLTPEQSATVLSNGGT